MSKLLNNYEKNLDHEQARDYNNMIRQNREFQKRRDKNAWKDEVLGPQPIYELNLSPALESLIYIEEELEASPFTWSEPLIESFSQDLRSMKFHNKLLKNKWSNEAYLLERVAKDQVIRGYFSDEEQAQELNFSCIKEALANLNEVPAKQELNQTKRSRRCTSHESRQTRNNSKTNGRSSSILIAVEGEK